MTRYGITVSSATIEQLKAVKEKFSHISHTKYSWDNFMLQIGMLGECLMRDHDVNSTQWVKLERVGAWFGQAYCPYCGQKNSPLKLKDGIVWGVNCEKCGRRFIVLI